MVVVVKSSSMLDGRVVEFLDDNNNVFMQKIVW
jgi:hypothetical protein